MVDSIAEGENCVCWDARFTHTRVLGVRQVPAVDSERGLQE